MQYLFYSLSVIFFIWAIGECFNKKIIGKKWYMKFSNLNFIKYDKTRKLIGLVLFKRILTNTILNRFNSKLKLNERKKPSDLRNLRLEMLNAEISHLIAFLLALIFSIIVLPFHKIFSTLIFSLNIPMNLYPSLLQQQNKERIDKILRNLDLE